MFLVHTLIVFFVIYVISAVLAETIFTSEVEQKLPLAVRVGFGYIFSLFYFSSTWWFLSIRQAWVLGVILCALYLYGKTSKQILNLEWNHLKQRIKKHGEVLCVLFVSANLFFLPLYLANEYGPFSEGGGDVSVYSDVAKRLTDFNLTGTGLEESASLKERYSIIKTFVEDKNSEGYIDKPLEFTNPPKANSQINKLAFSVWRNPLQYVPCAQFAFLSGATNHTIFYAQIAFLYSLILAIVWGSFRRFGWLPATISILIVGGSHSLVSGFYNMYLLQALSTMILALTLASIPFICFLSIPGLKTYGVISAFVIISYFHFFPIICLLLIITLFKSFYPYSEFFHSSKNNNKTSSLSSLLHPVSCGVFNCIIFSGIVVGFSRSFYMIAEMLKGVGLFNAKDDYSGLKVDVFSERWWVYFFGVASQQNFEPYALESLEVNTILPWGLAISFLVLIFGLSMFVLRRIQLGVKKPERREEWFYLLFYLQLFITTAIYCVASQSSLYTQAKGAQYLLLCVYTIMLWPLIYTNQKIDLMLLPKNFQRYFQITYVVILLGFSVFLWVPRMVYAERIALHKDRSTIIEPSFFLEAERIKEQDKNPLVIFEPRISADVYFPYQSFAGYRIVPSRHLFLTELISKGDSFKKQKYVFRLPSDFIKSKDLPHIWQLFAKKDENGKYLWQGERLIKKTTPYLVFTGNDYQIDFGVKSRFKRTKNILKPDEGGMFSYLRNGTVMVYLPPGGPYHLEVKIFNRNQEDGELELMAKEVTRRISNEEFKFLSSLENKNGIITLIFDFSYRSEPRLSLVSRYSSEYWFNARLNGKEMSGS
jgi:hypothetical protein